MLYIVIWLLFYKKSIYIGIVNYQCRLTFNKKHFRSQPLKRESNKITQYHNIGVYIYNKPMKITNKITCVYTLRIERDMDILLHTGQLFWRSVNQGLMHLTWNSCSHGSIHSLSFVSKSSRHTGHVSYRCPSLNFSARICGFRPDFFVDVMHPVGHEADGLTVLCLRRPGRRDGVHI